MLYLAKPISARGAVIGAVTISGADICVIIGIFIIGPVSGWK